MSIGTLSYNAPKELLAGDSIDFLVQVPGDYSGWTGSCRLTGPSATLDGTISNSNGDFEVYFPGQGASGTHTLAAGQYLLTVWVTSGNDRKTIEQFPLTITADLSTGTPAQVHAVKMLDLLETAIYNRLNGTTDGGIDEYTIDGTSVKKLTMDDLQKLRARYAAEVARLGNPNAPLGSIKFHFSQAGTVPDLRRRFTQQTNGSWLVP